MPEVGPGAGRAMRAVQDRDPAPQVGGRAVVDRRAPGREPVVRVELRVGEQRVGQVHVAALVVESVAPQQVVCADRVPAHAPERAVLDPGEEVVHHHAVGPAAHAVEVPHDGVVDEDHVLGQGSAAVVLVGLLVGHAADGGLLVPVEQIALDPNQHRANIGQGIHERTLR
jgi:hypothetical protein